MIIRTDDPVTVGETGRASIWDGQLKEHPDTPYVVLSEATRADWETYWREHTTPEMFAERLKAANKWAEDDVRYYRISID